MRYHDVKLRALIRVAAVALFLAVLAALSLVYPDQAASVARLWKPRGFSNPIFVPVTLGIIALIVSIVGVWMALLTPAQEARMIRNREAKGKKPGTPHPSLFDASDPDYHVSTVRYLLRRRRR